MKKAIQKIGLTIWYGYFAGRKDRRMKKAIQKIGLTIWYGYFAITMLAVPVFNWRYAREHGFVSWLCLGEVVATLKAVVWPYYAFTSSRKPMTSDERAFAEQWNQWLEDHP